MSIATAVPKCHDGPNHMRCGPVLDLGGGASSGLSGSIRLATAHAYRIGECLSSAEAAGNAARVVYARMYRPRPAVFPCEYATTQAEVMVKH